MAIRGGEEIRIPIDGSELAAWLYRPAASGPTPGIVLMHGLTAPRDAQLDRYCERFAAAGIAALAFDFRHLGSSDGEPRQLVNIARQYEDYDAALEWIRSQDDVEPDRIAIWGTSFAGGYAVDAAVRHPWLAAAVAQTPLVDGRRVQSQGPRMRTLAWGLTAALRDRARARRGASPHYVPVLGPPGSRAVITTPDLWESYTERWGLFERRDAIEGTLWRNEVAARLLLETPKHRPIQRAERVRCPLLVQIVENEGVVSNGSAIAAADRAPRGTLKRYDGLRHFDIYAGDGFERIVGDQVEFLREALAVTEGQAA